MAKKKASKKAAKKPVKPVAQRPDVAAMQAFARQHLMGR